MMSESTLRYRSASSVLFRDLGGESVLLDVESGFYFGLDEVGTRIWTLLEQHREVDPVCRVLAREYEVDEETLVSDVTAFVGTLVQRGLLRPVPAGLDSAP